MPIKDSDLLLVGIGDLDSRCIYYVYAHYTKDTNELFYIGKGTGARFRTKSGRNTYWQRVVAKHGFITIKLSENLDEQQALMEESRLIEKLEPRTNLSKGMRGSAGYCMAEEEKQRRRLQYSGQGNPFCGKHHTEETKQRLCNFHNSPILCENLETGEIVVLSGTRKAADYTRIPRQTIMRLLKKPGTKQLVPWKFSRVK